MGTSEIQSEIDAICADFVDRLEKICQGGVYLRQGMVQEGVTSLIWDTVFQFPEEKFALAEALDGISDAIRNWKPSED